MYRAGLYVRLSRDDGADKVSESIKNQQDFLLRYAAEQGFEVAEIYADDGWSGTNFDRPAFQRMIRDIEEKKINLVLTKDLSRLGRDYILTGHYLERYFPEHQIRYIAVNDGIDTFENSIANELNPFKAVMNDMYARDISNKVRTALTTKKQNGKFIGAFAPFGYQKSAEDKNKLEVDPLTAPTVKRIFQLFLSGESMKRIAQRLTQEGVLTPSKQRQAQRGADRWNDVMIKRILTNETYIGNLTQNRTRKINYKLKKKQRLEKEQWITVEHTHQGIVSQEAFRQTQILLGKRTYRPIRREGKEHRLSGLVYCADCGSKMTFLGEYLVCSNWRKDSKNCSSHSIREQEAEAAAAQWFPSKFLPERVELALKVRKITVDKGKQIGVEFMEPEREGYKNSSLG